MNFYLWLFFLLPKGSYQTPILIFALTQTPLSTVRFIHYGVDLFSPSPQIHHQEPWVPQTLSRKFHQARRTLGLFFLDLYARLYPSTPGDPASHHQQEKQQGSGYLIV